MSLQRFSSYAHEEWKRLRSLLWHLKSPLGHQTFRIDCRVSAHPGGSHWKWTLFDMHFCLWILEGVATRRVRPGRGVLLVIGFNLKMKAMAMDRNKMMSPMMMLLLASLLLASALATSEAVSSGPLVATSKKKNAYATMLYMGTPRDYEFYIAARVMLQTLARFQVNADLVVIASSNVPHSWRRAL